MLFVQSETAPSDSEEFDGILHVLYEPEYRREKQRFVQQSLEFPIFRTVAKKRGAKFDLMANAKRKCQCITSSKEIFDGPMKEVFEEYLKNLSYSES